MKVSDLSGAQLDYWVAKAEGMLRLIKSDSILDKLGDYSPSTKWKHGGPIIEREQEAIDQGGAGGLWRANGVWKAQLKREGWVCEGDTPLIAAMRAYVASKFGDEVPGTVP